jgi:hypothetical protein
MAGLVPAIHVLIREGTWMPGTRPGMTTKKAQQRGTQARLRGAHRVRMVQNESPSNRQRAQGMPGASAGTHGLACDEKEHTSVVATGESRITGIPCAMVLTVSCALSPVSVTS